MAAASKGMESPASAIELDRRRTIGRISGSLFIAGALLSLPSALLADPAPPALVYVIMAAALCSGIVFMVFPWERRSAAWLHLIPVVGAIEITMGIRVTGVHGSLYSWLYMLIAISVAYSFRSRKVIGAYMLMITLAMATQLIDTPMSTREVLRNIFVSVPSLLISCGVIVYFRERLEAGHRTYQRLARLDPLTGVGNYRALHERLVYEIARHERHRRSFAVLLVDLDSFKDVNERHGHLEGDRILREVGRALESAIRDEDTVARQGGDEFSVLVPEADEADVRLLTERIQSALGLIVVDDRALAAAVGWAMYPRDGRTPETLLARADSALLRSKRADSAKTKRFGSPRTRRAPGQAGAHAGNGSL